MDPSEAPAVVQTPGGLSVSYRGRLLYSGREPGRTPRRAAEACDPGPRRLHLVASPLLWYGLPELLARMGEGSAALCVEADPALADLARRYAPPGLVDGRRVAFLESSSPEELAEAASRLGSFRKLGFLALSGGESLNAPLYRRMAELLGEEIERSWRNRASLMVMGRLWARNIVDNLAALPDIAPRPLPPLPGATAVCGAGPSLEAALPLLARNRPSLSVVACDTALGSLLASGIEPDLVVCLEAQAHNLADFTPLGSRPIALAADLSSHPATFRAPRGPKHLSAVRITASPFLERASSCLEAAAAPFLPMPALGSVGVHAAHLARQISRGPLLAFGLDFCFEAGKTHARGCPSILAEERRLSRLRRWGSQYASSLSERSGPLPVSRDPGRPGRRGPGGPELRSDPVLLSYAALLAQEASLPGPVLYDARGRGPSIGARRIGLEEAEAMVRGQGRAAGPPRPGIESRPAWEPGRAREAAAAFLDGELARLDALYDFMKGRSAAGREEALRLAAECDYLYWGFADADRAGELPQDFLNRLLPETDWWARRLGRARRALGA